MYPGAYASTCPGLAAYCTCPGLAAYCTCPGLAAYCIGTAPYGACTSEHASASEDQDQPNCRMCLPQNSAINHQVTTYSFRMLEDNSCHMLSCTIDLARFYEQRQKNFSTRQAERSSRTHCNWQNHRDKAFNKSSKSNWYQNRFLKIIGPVYTISLIVTAQRVESWQLALANMKTIRYACTVANNMRCRE